MATLTELIDTGDKRESGESTLSGPSVKHRSRKFRADIAPQFASPLTLLGYPEVGQPHNIDGTLTCYDVDANYWPGSVNESIITAHYSNDPPTWGSPADPFFKSWTLSYYRVAQPLPYAVRDVMGYRYIDAQGNPQGITTYPVAMASHWESRMKFVRHVRVTGLVADDWNAISDQSNKIHKIEDRWYLFQLGDVQELRRNVWDTTYTFEFDPGTPDIFQNIDPDQTWPFGFHADPPMPGGPTYARPPYTEIRLKPDYNAQTGLPAWPIYVPVYAYEFAENGHLNLPGFY